jgi:indole-3-glycerol phosphate synthase
MKDILEEIVANKRLEVERFKQEVSEREIHRQVEAICDFSTVSMKTALVESESGIIAEFKRKSPSKGWIKEEGKADIMKFGAWTMTHSLVGKDVTGDASFKEYITDYFGGDK